MALVGCAVAEPPVGYSYSAPGLSHGSSGSVLSGGGHYTSVPVGHQSSEGYHIDPHLLEKIRHIILKDEIHNQAYQSSASSGHGISSHYGPPAPVYGVPHDRIVGVELESLQQGLQVAQYHQAVGDYSGGYAGGYSGGYSSGYSGGYSGGHSGGYSGGHGYSTINIPSESYGVPSPSSSYGVPH